MLRRSVFAAACTALLVPATVFASGFEVPDNGTRSLGRGGAYAASVDEPTAIYYNPAALTRIRRTAVTANLTLFSERHAFERESFEYYDGTIESELTRRQIDFDRVESETGWFPAPMLFAASNFGLENWTFGAAAYGPSSHGRTDWPDMQLRPPDWSGDQQDYYEPGRGEPITRDGGNAYMELGHDLLLVYPSLAAAYHIENLNLSVGLTAQLALLWVDYDVGVDGLFGTGSVNQESRERADLYSTTKLDTFGMTVTGILGVLWEPTDRIAIGASYRPRHRIRTEGTIEVGYPQSLLSNNPQIDDDTAYMTTWMPDVVRLGAVYTHRDGSNREIFDVEANLVYEGWHVAEGFEVELNGRLSDDAGATNNQALPDLFLERNWQDTFSVRLGSDLSMLRNAETGNGLVLRLGGYYERSAQPEEWTNLDFMPFDRLAGTLGASYHIGAMSIDAAYAYVASPSRTVTDGEYELLVPLWVCNDPPDEATAEACEGVTDGPGHPVNNGRYETGFQMISLGLTWGW